MSHPRSPGDDSRSLTSSRFRIEGSSNCAEDDRMACSNFDTRWWRKMVLARAFNSGCMASIRHNAKSPLPMRRYRFKAWRWSMSLCSWNKRSTSCFEIVLVASSMDLYNRPFPHCCCSSYLKQSLSIVTCAFLTSFQDSEPWWRQQFRTKWIDFPSSKIIFAKGIEINLGTICSTKW